MTSEELYHKLEAVCANDQSVQTHHYSSTTPTYDSITANSIQTRPEKQSDKNTKLCHSFAKGNCTRNHCRFQHSLPPSEQKQSFSHSQSQQRNAHPKNKCYRCGSDDHSAKECKYNGKCGHCGRNGHMESVCNAKKAGKPRALFSSVDGSQVHANMFKATMPISQTIGGDFPSHSPPPLPDTVRETFLADTGANQHLHPNGRSAISFSRVSLDISTAAAGNSMRSEGVGAMKLYTPTGQVCPGFENVVFSKQCAAKLASVGHLCDDADLVCVFRKSGLTTYKEQQVEIKGNIFTSDARDKKTGLFPLSLYRKVAEKKSIANNIFISHASDSLALPEEKKSEKFIFAAMPECILDGETMPIALLAKTYVKEGLSDVERLHAKCGDVGIKYLKRAFPSLKIPKQYRCEFCIEGKIHKFGHGACKPGERTEYLPGVFIDSDHSGPYARSYGGARYSQLFYDRGSTYLWGFRQKKKTEHYESTPVVFVDAQALSSRPVQIFHSDGDGVFSGSATIQMLKEHKIRHEFSAPYDSNTNPFVERARRTIFEGVCTALLRAGAPASWWGEAEAHKIFSLNNLPTIPDKENPENSSLEKIYLWGIEGLSTWKDLWRLVLLPRVMCQSKVDVVENNRLKGDPFVGLYLATWRTCLRTEFGTWKQKKSRVSPSILQFVTRAIIHFETKIYGLLSASTILQIFHQWWMVCCLRSSGKNSTSTNKKQMKFLL